MHIIDGDRQRQRDGMGIERICKEGIITSLTLNQETAKWVLKQKLIIEGFYLRSGRNFSADWLSRADLDQILEWSHRMGFRRARFMEDEPNPLLTGSRITLTTGRQVQFYWSGKSLDFQEFARKGILLEEV